MQDEETTLDQPSEVASGPGHRDHAEGPKSIRTPLIAAVAITAGLIAGIISWGVGVFASRAFQPPRQRSVVMGQVILKARYEDQAAADYKNAILCSTILGASLASCLGVAGGLLRASFPSALNAGTTGLFLGGLLSAGSAAALLPVYFRAEDQSPEALSRDLTIPMLVLGGPCAAAGLGGGLTLGFGLGRGRVNLLEAGLGGLLGGLLGAVLYLVVGSLAFSSSKTAVPLPPDWLPRLLGGLLVSLLASLMAAIYSSRHLVSLDQAEN